MSSGDTAVLFHDLGKMAGRLNALAAVFPESALHAVAIKANPLVRVLGRCVVAGAGLEAASIEEVHLALAAGCAPDRIVFDSPAKTQDELTTALRRGIHINADNLAELERIGQLRAALQTQSRVGLRINPEVGVGSIAATSVATAESRFGMRADESVLDAFRQNPWLTCLHVHVGSQGCDLKTLSRGAHRIWELRERIHQAIGGQQITTIDIGGGLPAPYSSDEGCVRFAEYACALQQEVPGLFDGSVRLITEFGRSLHAGCGFAVSRVEYVKKAGQRNVAVLHLGADFLLRRVYAPDHWHHEFVVLDAAGVEKSGPTEPWSLAGPLCFAGDVLGRDLLLPEIHAGDHILIRDVGAYTLSMWSRHCSRAMPQVLGYDDPGDPAPFVILRARESAEDVVRSWGP